MSNSALLASTITSWIVGITALSEGVLLCGCSRAQDSRPAKTVTPIAVQTILPERGEIARRISLPTFRILAFQEATLFAKVSGYLKSISVDKGDAVKEGQLLAQIEVPELLADEMEYKAEMEVARTNYDRLVEARGKAPDLVVPQTIDDLRGKAEVAQAKLQRVRTLLEFARITAPFSGTITARFADPGAFIPAATGASAPQSAALVTLMDFSRIRVQVYVPETEVPFVRNELPCQIRVEELPAKVFEGTVTRFAHALDQGSKSMLTEIELPNPTAQLRPGMYANVLLEVERKSDALLVPVGAVLVEKAGSSVFIVSEGKAKKTPVRIGFNDGKNAEIVEGLAITQPVILSGKQTLNDGQPVTVSEAK